MASNANFPLISVIIPVYNAEKYLDRCVNSIRNQTYENLEIILVDDGSTDISGTLCDRFAAEDSRIKTIHKENGGNLDPRNAGILLADGEYIGFVDDDDYFAPDMYAEMYRAIIETDTDMVVCDYTYVDEDGNDLNHDSPIKISEIVTYNEYFKRLSEPNNGYYVTVWNRLYKSEIIKRIVFPVDRIYRDSYAAHRIVGECDNIYIYAKKLCFYTQRSGSMSSISNDYRYFDLIESLVDRVNYYRFKEYNDLICPAVEYLIDCHLNERRKYLRSKKNTKGIRYARSVLKDVRIQAKNCRKDLSIGYQIKALIPDLFVFSSILHNKLQLRKDRGMSK
ncbi:MAG: glycosyltransferase [Lachnospiraceae bacterium]|nr:glycosyltransferase [Lachnospiraceae bacterium]